MQTWMSDSPRLPACFKIARSGWLVAPAPKQLRFRRIQRCGGRGLARYPGTAKSPFAGGRGETSLDSHAPETCYKEMSPPQALRHEMEKLTDEKIASTFEPYVRLRSSGKSEDRPLAIGPAFYDQVRAYIQLLLKWNRSISLTTVRDPDEILRFHFGESLFAASILRFQNGRLADFGTGPGFPGLPIRMVTPSLKLSLIESNLKKCAFLAEAIRVLGLSGVVVLRSRAEDLRLQPGSFEFVTARAFGQFELLLRRAREILTLQGQVILWVGEKDCESIAKRDGWKWLDPVRIPNSERRFILIGSPKAME